MKKEPHYYLVKQWQPHRGTSKENPSCVFGQMSYFVKLPLKDINPNFCYTSRKNAERMAEKYTSLYSRAEVIEVPKTAMRLDQAENMESPPEKQGMILM